MQKIAYEGVIHLRKRNRPKGRPCDATDAVCKHHPVKQYLKVMRLIILLLTVTCLQVSATGYGQQITIKKRNASLEKIFQDIYSQTGYQFVYTYDLIQDANKVSIDAKDASLKEVLTACFQNQPFTYLLMDKAIIVKRKSKPDESQKLALNPIVVKGKVTDSLGNPLIGVTVKAKGGGTGTVTDAQGNYSITVPDDAVLMVSYIGYRTKEVPVVGRKNINIKLKAVVSELNQLVVVGYGTTIRKDLTGSVSSAPLKDMSKAPVPSFAQALEGRVAGVVVSSPDAQPGSGLNIVIRGNNSITQNNSPLYVVDGFPIEDPNNNVINPNDIASIEILKDASATAIYGARGANGVILITTKKGKEGPPVITLDASYGFQNLLKTMDLMSPYEFVKYQLEVSPGDTDIVGSAPYYYLRHGSLNSYMDTAAIDWQSRLFRVAPIQNYNVAIRGGSKRTKYSISGNVFNQDGIIINSDYTRYQGRIVLDETISDKLKVGINTNYSYLKQNGISPAYASQSGGSSTKTMMYSVWGFRPFGNNLIEDAFDPDVSSANDYRFNPVLNQKNLVRTNTYNILNANAYLQYHITPHLTLKISGGIYSNIRESISFNDTLTSYGNPKLSINGINGRDLFLKRNSWVNENTLTYKNTFNRYHRLDVVVGVTEQKQTTGTSGSAAINLPEQASGISWLSSGTPSQILSAASSNTIASLLGRINYAYHSKYLLTVSFRADGSSKFAPQNHWSYFPSGAVAWRFGDENFFKNSPVISNGKLRISYGVTGNNRVSDFAYLSQFSTSAIQQGYTFEGTPTPGTIPLLLGNPNLKWETTAQTDIGLDVGLLKDRIDVTIDAYRKKTTNLLLHAEIPASYGFNTIYKNIGSVQNQGIEFTLSTSNIKTKAFSWSSDFNIAFNSNKVLSLAENQHAITNLYAPFDNTIETVPAFVAIVGRPMGLMYGPVWDGVYQKSDFTETHAGDYILKDNVPTNGNPRTTIQPGDIKYKDINGDGVVNNDDFTVLGRGLPIHSGGFSNNFTYKGFDLNIFFQWSYGNDILNANRLIFEGNSLAKQGLNQFADYTKRWTSDNPSNTLFRVGGQGPRANMFSSRVIEDGSYLRLKTVSLGYNLPHHLINKWNIQSLRVYVSGQNLYTWTKYSGMDPEVSIYNNVLTPDVDFSAYPRALIVTFGVKVSF